MSRAFKIALLLLTISLGSRLLVFGSPGITVSANGKDCYHSIQQAIVNLNSSSSQERNIYSKNGNYHDKIMIENHKIILEGKSTESAIISCATPGEKWRCHHKNDYYVATTNVEASVINLRNPAKRIGFGFVWKEDITIKCMNDSSLKKVIRRNGNQARKRLNGEVASVIGFQIIPVSVIQPKNVSVNWVFEENWNPVKN